MPGVILHVFTRILLCLKSILMWWFYYHVHFTDVDYGTGNLNTMSKATDQS